MDKKIAALLGAAAALTTVGSVQAATASAAQLQPATSYRDLLEPVPNAVALLRADDERLARTPTAGETQVAQYHHHHHHHHHNGYYPGAAILGGVIGGIIGAQPGYYGPPPGNCYWTIGRPYWNGYAWIRPRVQVCE